MAETKIEHIVWDWNGTLLDDVDACVEAINCMMQRRGLGDLERTRYVDIFEFPVKNYYRGLGFDLDNEDWDEMALEFHEHYARTARTAGLREGIRELLEYLRDGGMPMSVLSACEENILNRMMAERCVDTFFSRVHGLSHLYATSKVTLGQELMATLGVHASSVLLIGDTLHDHEVALELGCRCLLVAGGHQSMGRLQGCGADVIEEMGAVVSYVGQ
ncbi:MAG: HAD family hydrolase [Kiritimatiellae bacterium]|nr:HAD family hydrolase [Kiritimatiellia bacterium]